MRRLILAGIHWIWLLKKRSISTRTELRMTSGKVCSWLLVRSAILRLGQPSRWARILASVFSSKNDIILLLLMSNLVRCSHLSMQGDSWARLLSLHVNSYRQGNSIPSEDSTRDLLDDRFIFLSFLKTVSQGNATRLHLLKFKLYRLGGIGSQVIALRSLSL